MTFGGFYLGLLAMQVIYLINYFILHRRKEFLYYTLFTLGIAGFFYVRLNPSNEVLIRIFGEGNVIPAAYCMLLGNIFFYYNFLRHFTEAPVVYPFFNNVLRMAGGVALITSLFLLLCIIIVGVNRVVEITGITIYTANFLVQAYLIYFLLRTGKRLNIIVIAGSVVMTIMIKTAILPRVINLSEESRVTSHLDLVLLGLVADFIFLSFTMTYKSWLAEKEKVRLLLETQRELHRQRVEISNDLHDDVGGTLSSLQVYADLAATSLEKEPVRTKEYISRISSGIRLVMANMNDVIWAVNDEKRESKLFSSRLKDFFWEVFDARNIECHYEIDPETESGLTRIIARKYLLLITKEAVNNSLKHSGASLLRIVLKREGDWLLLSVFDNGNGMPETHSGKGFGLDNLKARASKLNGSIQISSAPGGGTLVECRVPFTSISEEVTVISQ